jgi:hypothetical protein
MSSRVRRTITAAVWLVAALGAAPGGAQQPTAPAWMRARLDGRFDARARVAVERVIDSAFALGIPAEPLIDKALQGQSKGASTEVIVRAMRALAIDLASARRALGSQALAVELAAGADALRAGVDTRSIERLRRDRPGQPLVVALGVLTDLIQRGVPVDAATKSVLELTKAGIADEQLVAFRRGVERDVGLGAAPASAALLQAADFSASFARDGTGSGLPGSTRPGAAPRLKP